MPEYNSGGNTGNAKIFGVLEFGGGRENHQSTKVIIPR